MQKSFFTPLKREVISILLIKLLILYFTPLKREVISILLIKLLILYVLKVCFFSEPIAQHWTVPHMDGVFFSSVIKVE